MYPNLLKNTSFPRRSLVQALLRSDHRYDEPEALCYPEEPSKTTSIDFGENSVEWSWDVPLGNDFVDLLNERDVTFHKRHSSGTAVVRGTQAMSKDQHFWEIEMISPVYGTDMMVGIGTSEADMSQLQDMYVSRLGNDNLTWGLSYTGLFYHNGEGRNISRAFDQGSIIGLHLDMWNGTLSFYKNSKYLGVASKGLKGKTLYAMASSTAACSGMRMLRSCSFPSSLQFLCCSKLRNIIPDDKCVLNELSIPPGLRLFLENNLGWLLNARLREKHPLKDTYLSKDNFLSKNLDCCFKVPLQKFQSCDKTLSENVRGNSACSSDSEVNFIVVGRRNIPLALRRYQRHTTSVSAPETSTSIASSTDEDSVEDLDERNVYGNEVKRRRCSYNYPFESSDPDSES